MLQHQPRFTQQRHDLIITFSCQTDDLIRYSGNNRHQKQTDHHPQYRGRHPDKQEENNTDNHDKQQKARSAAFVLSRAFHHILHIQFQSVFHTVDTLMFRSVVHKYPLDIFHSGNQHQISEKQDHTHACFRNGNQSLRCCHMSQKVCQKIRQHDKQSNGKYHGKCHRSVHQPFFFFFFLFFCLFFFGFSGIFLFFVLDKACRVHQTLDPHNQRFKKRSHTPENRQFPNATVFCPALVWLHLHLDLTVRLSDTNGILISTAHHDTFHDGLTTYI